MTYNVIDIVNGYRSPTPVGIIEFATDECTIPARLSSRAVAYLRRQSGRVKVQVRAIVEAEPEFVVDLFPKSEE